MMCECFGEEDRRPTMAVLADRFRRIEDDSTLLMRRSQQQRVAETSISPGCPAAGFETGQSSRKSTDSTVLRGPLPRWRWKDYVPEDDDAEEMMAAEEDDDKMVEYEGEGSAIGRSGGGGLWSVVRVARRSSSYEYVGMTEDDVPLLPAGNQR